MNDVIGTIQEERRRVRIVGAKEKKMSLDKENEGLQEGRI